ncbi:MAG: Ldh family oxidoreductase, partial [Variibacter sp.]|nr:Ldh family oxidoreductase [Variibacter sp.]
ASRPLPGFGPIRLPGDRRHALRQERLRDGIPVSAALRAQLDALASKLGIAALP